MIAIDQIARISTELIEAKRSFDDLDAAEARYNARMQQLADDAERARRAVHLVATEAAMSRVQILAMTDAFYQAQTDGSTAIEALQTVVKEAKISSADDLSELAAGMQQIGGTAKVSAAEINDTLVAKLKALPTRELNEFGVFAESAFAQGKLSAEQLGTYLDVRLRAIVEQSGQNSAAVFDGMGRSARDAIENVAALGESYEQLKSHGADAGAVLKAALDKALSAADSQGAFDTLTAQVSEFGKAGKLSAEQVAEALLAIEKRVGEALPGVNTLSEAFSTLGLKSQAELQLAADSAKDAFDFISNSGKASASQIQDAFVAYAQKAIAANGGVADAALEVKAAMYDVSVQVDSTGNAIVEAMGKSAYAITQALDTRAKAAQTVEDLEKIRQEVMVLGATGRISGEQMDEALKAVSDRLDEIEPGITSVNEAFHQLGMKTPEELNKAASLAQEAFDAIVESGTASAKEVQKAFIAYADAAIEANGGVADAQLKVEAAMYQVQIQADSTGQDIARAMDDTTKSVTDVADAVQQLGDDLKGTGNSATTAAAEASTAAKSIQTDWLDAKTAASQYADAAREAAWASVVGEGKTVSGWAQDMAQTYRDLNHAAERYIATMDALDERQSRLDVANSSAAQGVEDLKQQLLELEGNGTLAVLAIDAAADPQTLRVSLLDAGTSPVPARLDFFGVTLAAQQSGAQGNALTVEVVRELTFVDLPYATLSTLSAGTTALSGGEWDWGQPAAIDAGIPAGALRVAFSGFPTVHRAWKVWEDSAFSYRLDPAPAYDIPADTRVQQVSGDYALIVADGTHEEHYRAVTLYDFLSALQARSGLLAVEGVVARDMAPGGQAVTDIPLRTDARALPATMKISSERAKPLLVSAVDANAPTENITLRYADSGLWTVSGGVSGTLSTATTGVEWQRGPIRFTIPVLDSESSVTTPVSYKVEFATREDDEGTPSVCLKPLALGVNARQKTVTYVYTERPPAGCACKDMAPKLLNGKYLGLEDQFMGINDPAYVDRVKTLYAWREGFVRGNTLLQEATEASSETVMTSAGTPAVPAVDATQSDHYVYRTVLTHDSTTVNLEIDVGELADAPFLSLSETYAVTDLALGDQISLKGAQLPDTSYEMWDAVVTGVLQDGVYVSSYTGPLEARLAALWGKIVQDAWADGQAAIPGTAPTYSTVTTAGKPLAFLAESRDLDFANQALTILLDNLSDVYDVAAATALWDTLWSEVQADFAHLAAMPQDNVTLQARYLDRYRAVCDNILLAAGLLPKSDASAVGGDGSWRDLGDAWWWVDQAGEYAPAFTNAVYYSASTCHQNTADGKVEGEVYSTKEFGFGLLVACPERLKAGDQFTITISGSADSSAYQSGDQFVVPVIAGQAAAFAAGADGDPRQTWTVRGDQSGALPDWLYDPASPTAPYVQGPVSLQLSAGGIPFEVGDSFGFTIEGGQLQWRRDGGAWNTADLYGAALELGDGLQLAAVPGAAPSFVAGDQWTWRAVARWGASRIRQPVIDEAFGWDGPDQVIDLDLGAVCPIEAVLLALHTLPADAVILIRGGIAAADAWTLVPTWSEGPILAPLPAGTAARYLQVQLSNTGPGATLGWLWAGLGWEPSVGASELVLIRQYGLTRGSGLNAGGVYRGRGMAGKMHWSLDAGGALIDDVIDSLLQLIDHVVAQGLEPLCIVPDLRNPERSALVTLDADAVQLSEATNWQHPDERVVSVELDFAAVLA